MFQKGQEKSPDTTVLNTMNGTAKLNGVFRDDEIGKIMLTRGQSPELMMSINSQESLTHADDRARDDHRAQILAS